MEGNRSRNPGEMWAGSLREAEEERAGVGISKGGYIFPSPHSPVVQVGYHCKNDYVWFLFRLRKIIRASC